MSEVQLREHQVDGLAAIRGWTGFPVRRTLRPAGERATFVSATGSGKTITAAWAARDLCEFRPFA